MRNLSIFRPKLHFIIFQLDLQLQDGNGGDISGFITNGEWELLGKQITILLLGNIVGFLPLLIVFIVNNILTYIIFRTLCNLLREY